MNDAILERIGRWRTAIDAELSHIAATREDLPDVLRDAIHYSLTGEGKRFRGLLLIASYDALGGQSDVSGLAAAVEVVHAYSLVHDDLPCMDDDNMRRGRPTTHRQFGVATATVAGVTMVPLAVEQTIRAAEGLRLDRLATRRLVTTLMRASGAAGMVGGQLMDLDAEGRTLSVAGLERIHQAKTGALIAAALTMGGIAAGASEAIVSTLAFAGGHLGLAFQIADDVLDATGTSESLGKTAGRDAVLEKSTYASVLGVASASQRSDALVSDAMARLDAAGLRTQTIDRLAHFVAARRS